MTRAGRSTAVNATTGLRPAFLQHREVVRRQTSDRKPVLVEDRDLDVHEIHSRAERHLRRGLGRRQHEAPACNREAP